jgi:hypothetical protein
VEFLGYVISAQGITMVIREVRTTESGLFQLDYERCNLFSVSPIFIGASSKAFK